MDTELNNIAKFAKTWLVTLAVGLLATFGIFLTIRSAQADDEPTIWPTPSPEALQDSSPCSDCQSNLNTNINQNTQEQTQENTQEVNVNVSQTATSEVTNSGVVKVETKQPETGPSMLGYISMFSAVPAGYVLSRYARGRTQSVKKRDDAISMAKFGHDLVNIRNNRT